MFTRTLNGCGLGWWGRENDILVNDMRGVCAHTTDDHIFTSSVTVRCKRIGKWMRVRLVTFSHMQIGCIQMLDIDKLNKDNVGHDNWWCHLHIFEIFSYVCGGGEWIGKKDHIKPSAVRIIIRIVFVCVCVNVWKCYKQDDADINLMRKSRV